MNTFKNSFDGISHNKCRFIILIVVVCFFALSIALSAAVVNGTAKKAQEYKNSLATGFVITLDHMNPDAVFIAERFEDADHFLFFGHLKIHGKIPP